MAAPFGGRRSSAKWEYITPEMIRRDMSLERALERYPDVDAVIADFKAYVDAHPWFTFARNLDSYHNDVHPYQCRIICEPQYLRIVRPYANKVHKQYIDSMKTEE